MKNFRTIIVMLLVATMLIPGTSFGITANEGEEAESEVLCTVTEEGFFETLYMIKNGTEGEYNFSALSGANATDLDGLEVVIDASEYAEGTGNSISVLWTDEAFADYENHIRLGAGENTVNYCGPDLGGMLDWTNKGIAIHVKDTICDAEGKLVATKVTIEYYDKKSKPRLYEYDFPGEDNGRDDINLLNMDYPLQTEKENIDLSEKLRISVRADETLGFIVSINGKDYGNIKSDIYPYWAVDLKGLSELEAGYVTVGGYVYSQGVEGTSRLTVETINGEGADDWARKGGTPYECEMNGHDLVPDDPANKDPYSCAGDRYICTRCDYDIIYNQNSGHTNFKRIVTVEPTFDSEGEYDVICGLCKKVVNTFRMEKLKREYIDCYTDVNENAWYAPGVAYCTEVGFVEGTPENTFDPNGVLTREQFSVILAKVNGAYLDNYENADSQMKDVPTGKWYSTAIAWAVDNRYIKGIGEGYFGMGMPIDRASLVTLLYRFEASQLLNGAWGEADLSVYADSEEIPDWAVEAMNWAVSTGIIEGTDKNEPHLSPNMAVTRAQMAKILFKSNYIYNEHGQNIE